MVHFINKSKIKGLEPIFNKAVNIEFQPEYAENKTIQDIIDEYVNLLIAKVDIPTDIIGRNLLRYLIDTKVIAQINIPKYLHYNNYKITWEELAMLSNFYLIKTVKPDEIIIEVQPTDEELIVEFTRYYDCSIEE